MKCTVQHRFYHWLDRIVKNTILYCIFIVLQTVLKLLHLAKCMHKLTVPRVSFQSAGATLLLERVAVWRYYQKVTLVGQSVDQPAEGGDEN